MIGSEVRVPRWESELWDYVSSGDGMHCPLYDHCRIRLQGGWCFDDNRKRIEELVEYKQFSINNYGFIQCAPLCRIFQMVEMLAQSWLKRGRVYCSPVPTELVWLADDQHPIEVRQPSLKVYHGAIWRLKEEWVIQLKNDDTPATQRFTLFHEAFHILAHCRTTPVFRKRGAIQGSFNELLADYFAAYTLMPREWVKEKWAEVKDLDRMAEIFIVSKPAMCIRLKNLGLI